MSGKKKERPIRDKVIARVISGLILAGILSFVTWMLPGGWLTVGTWVSAAWIRTWRRLAGRA
jgi:hypothetical protein